jgi:hypothetical protein
MSRAALDYFGELLITKVRDESISDWEMIIDGRMKGDHAGRMRAIVASFSQEERGVILSLIPHVVDSVLHRLLATFEEEDDIRIAVVANGREVASLRDVSDGLAGELYSARGWIARFSERGV